MRSPVFALIGNAMLLQVGALDAASKVMSIAASGVSIIVALAMLRKQKVSPRQLLTFIKDLIKKP